MFQLNNKVASKQSTSYNITIKIILTQMNLQELEKFLILWHAPQLGYAHIQSILEHFPKVDDFLAQSSEQLQTLGLKPVTVQHLKKPDLSQIKKTLQWSLQNDQHLLTFYSPDYPQYLKEIASPPPLLFAKGNKTLFKYAKIAMVGSRNPSVNGLDMAANFSRHLSQQGFVIVSGMAMGIDAVAHEASIDSTIAVLGTGIDVIYPKSNLKLAEKIIEKGLMISEFPLGTQPKPQNFPRRNRIISGLSLGTLVVEAALKSGSLITAKYALEQGREVFAMPGSIHNPLAKGCHKLLKQGANLVESMEDIWQHFHDSPLVLNKNAQKSVKGLDINQNIPHIKLNVNTLTQSKQALLEAMGSDRITLDALSIKLSMSIQLLSANLLELELAGYIIKVPGGVQRAPPTY